MSNMRTNKYKAVLGAFAVVAAAFLGTRAEEGMRDDKSAQSIPAPPEWFRTEAMELGLSFPPVKDQRQLAFTAKHLKALDVRMIRIDEPWVYREPQKGSFKWGTLDARIEFVKDHDLSLWLTIQAKGPDWAAGHPQNEKSCVFKDEEDFRNYVSAILKRHPNVIDKIQFGNEWQTAYWYAGAAQDYVRFNNILYDEARTHSPRTKVVLGGFSTGALRGLAVLEGRSDHVYNARWQKVTGPELEILKASKKAWEVKKRADYVLEHARYDMLDLHLYDDVEQWPVYVEMMRERAPGKPIMVSEFGGPNLFTEDYTDEFQAERLRTYLETLNRLGVAEAYYFKLVESKNMAAAHKRSGLMRRNLEKKPAYEVFREFVEKSKP